MARNRFFCIDGHTCGNPVRWSQAVRPQLDGATMLERRAHFLAEYDWIRTGLMFEPRGHDMMSGAILYPSTRDDCDIAFLFIETSGCLPMCGHGTIGTVTMAIENGLVTRANLAFWHRHAGGPHRRPLQAGRPQGHRSALTNVPAFLHSDRHQDPLRGTWRHHR
jgi:4-hydroxyproline epimerase